MAETKSPVSDKAEQCIMQWNGYKGQRLNFEGQWQSLHDYFFIEADDISKSSAPGSELNTQVLYDSTTLEAADVLASGFMNYLTPPSSKWFSLRPRNPAYVNNNRVAAYFEEVVDQVNAALNRSNFYSQIHNTYKQSGVYGTSVLLEEDDPEDDIRFYSIPIKQVCLVEDGRGRVIGYYIEFEYTVEQAADKWGEDKLCKEMRECLKGDNKAKQNKHTFLLYITKRHRREVGKMDKKNLPIEATWIDVKNKHIVDEGGYHEMPAMCHRFEKRPFIPWGYSPGMKTLWTGRMLNAIAKTTLRSMMKSTDPSIAVPDNAFIMPFNQNPRAVNYYRRDQMPNGSKDVFAFSNQGNPEAGLKAIEYYSTQVRSLMYNDVFLAFSGITKEMNNPEVMERINEKMTLLGPAVGRYISDVNTPVIVRTIGILERRGKLPPKPQELVDDPGYEIDCISQLAQAQRRSELNALLSGLQLASQIATFKPEVLDKIDGDKTLDEAWSIIGAPKRIFMDDADVAALRDARGRAAAAQQKLDLANAGADIIKKGSEVDKNLAAARTSVNSPEQSIK